jgi:hypothetical protein
VFELVTVASVALAGAQRSRALSHPETLLARSAMLDPLTGN